LRTLLPLKPKLKAMVGKTDCYELEEDIVIFNGNCEVCRPYCQSLCCQVYKFVELSEAEAKSGLYQYIEETPGCACEKCAEMREAGIRYSLTKTPDHSCVNLDEHKMCSIYEIRPQTCRTYNCKDRILPFVTEQ
jgi:Fe-S-cluster containining protein